MKDLVEKGKVTRGWLGVVIQDITLIWQSPLMSR